MSLPLFLVPLPLLSHRFHPGKSPTSLLHLLHLFPPDGIYKVLFVTRGYPQAGREKEEEEETGEGVQRQQRINFDRLGAILRHPAQRGYAFK